MKKMSIALLLAFATLTPMTVAANDTTAADLLKDQPTKEHYDALQRATDEASERDEANSRQEQLDALRDAARKVNDTAEALRNASGSN